MEITILVKDDVCQHFWHFVMGEFLPIIYILQDIKPSKVYLFNSKRDWNSPFDKFYHELNFNIVMTNCKPKESQFYKYNKWDFTWNDTDCEKCLKSVEYLKKLVIESDYPICNQDKVLVHYRICNEELKQYYKQTYKKIKNEKGVIFSKQYGSEKRKIKNMECISNYLANTKFVNSDNKPMLHQISDYINQDKLILEHGAGMFFVLFMNNNSNIIEIKTSSSNKTKNGAVDGLKRICSLKKNNLQQLIVKDNSSISSYKTALLEKTHIFNPN